MLMCFDAPLVCVCLCLLPCCQPWRSVVMCGAPDSAYDMCCALQGASLGCKPTVAVLKYMQDSNTSLSELQQLLQPLLEAEQHLPPQQPVPTPRCSPAETTAALRHQLQAATEREGSSSSSTAASSSNCVGSGSDAKPAQQRLAHLLRNLELTERTLAVMHQQEGFKQVAWGPLELWYWHDTVSKSQIIRARVVLNEPLSVSLCQK